MKYAEVTINTGGAMLPFNMTIPLTEYRLFDNSTVEIPLIFMDNKIFLNREKASELHRRGPHGASW